MLAAMINSDDINVRALLDQRAQRADVPATRFSTFSDRSDSPSLYSHFDNSYPRSPAVLHSSPFPHLDDEHFRNTRNGFSYSLSPAQRLADPHASLLDLSDDRSIAESGSAISNADIEDGIDIDDESTSQPADDGDLESRLSLMGPKMRVHSRAPWETEQDDGSVSDDDGGGDSHSVFGGKSKNTTLTVMRGFGFGGTRSPVPRKSTDSASTSKGKRSFETSSSITAGGAIQALAQASMSSTSLIMGSSISSNRQPQNHSRLAVGRDRTLSVGSSVSDNNTVPPPLPSPQSAVSSRRSNERDSPRPRDGHAGSSPSHTIITDERSRSPSPYLRERKGSFVHPYANLSHIKSYDRNSYIDPFGEEPKERQDRAQMGSQDSTGTLIAEDTVTFSHSSSTTTSAFSSSTTDSNLSTSATSQFSSSVSSGSRDLEADIVRQDRLKRETKLGPIGQPSMLAHSNFPHSTPYTLISLEQAQAQARVNRGRSATIGDVQAFDRPTIVPFGGQSVHAANTILVNELPRSRTTSASSKLKYAVAVDVVKKNDGEVPSPLSTSLKQPSPIAHPGGKVIRPKRSGFLKLFNGKEKQQTTTPPPVPSLTELQDFTRRSEPPVPQSPTAKLPMHRVPVPPFGSSSPTLQGTSKSKKISPPPLSIKVTSAPGIPSQRELQLFNSPQSLKVENGKLFSSKPPVSAPAGTTHFPSLSLRPVSSFFDSSFSEQLGPDALSPGNSSQTGEISSLASPASYSSDGISPSSASSYMGFGIADNEKMVQENPSAVIASLKEQIKSSRKKWQQQIWELEGQIRDLKEDITDMQSGDKCEACGRGVVKSERKDSAASGVIHRPRAKTGCGARFANGNDF